MKTVKNLNELRELALRTGGSVSLGGQRFNSTGERAKLPRRPAEPGAPEPAEAPAAAPTPAAPPELVLSDSALSLLDRLAQAIEAQTTALVQAPQEREEPEEPEEPEEAGAAAEAQASPWVLDFTPSYDDEGRITRVRVTGTPHPSDEEEPEWRS